jgi:hypothetical protein
VGVHACHFKDGKIKEAWNIVDGVTPALELGVVKILHINVIICKNAFGPVLPHLYEEVRVLKQSRNLPFFKDH